MLVVRDLLDKAIKDRRRHEMGRVDGIVVDYRPGEPPRLSAVLVGPSVLAYRLHPRLERWSAALESALGLPVGRPLRLQLRDLIQTDQFLIADVNLDTTAAGAVEGRLRQWLRKIPRP